MSLFQLIYIYKQEKAHLIAYYYYYMIKTTLYAFKYNKKLFHPN